MLVRQTFTGYKLFQKEVAIQKERIHGLKITSHRRLPQSGGDPPELFRQISVITAVISVQVLCNSGHGLLADQLGDDVRNLIGLTKHGNTGLHQDLGTRKVRHFLGKIGITDL